MQIIREGSQKFEECVCTNCDLRIMFFKNVKDQEMKTICSTKIQYQFHKGEQIIQEGDPILNFSYLKSGLVKLYKTNGASEQIIHIAKPFDFVSILSVFSQEKYQYSVRALEESVVCNIKMSKIFNISHENSEFAMDLMRRMSEVSDRIIQEMLEIRKRNLKGRVAFVLLYFANDIFRALSFELPVSRKEIAEYIGMSTENVIRTLSEFRKDKVIKIFGKVIEIEDKEGLEMISKHG